jgi:hypothetical protein
LNAYVQGGNAFGATGVLGVTDGYPLVVEAVGSTVTVSSTGAIVLQVLSTTGSGVGIVASTNGGTGDAIQATANGGTATANNYAINAASAGSTSTIFALNSSTGPALTAKNTSSGPAISVINSSSGDGIDISVGVGYCINAATSNAASYAAQFINRGNNAGAGGLIVQAGTPSAATYIQFNFGPGLSPAAGGNITQSGTVTNYNASSDARIKENVRPASRGLEALKKLKVVEYSFIQDPTHTVVQGLIAQDVKPIFPEAVHTPHAFEPLTMPIFDARRGLEATQEREWEEKEAARKADLENPFKNPWGIDYGKLTPLLIKAVQDLSAKVDSLQSEVTMLRAKK